MSSSKHASMVSRLSNGNSDEKSEMPEISNLLSMGNWKEMAGVEDTILFQPDSQLLIK